MFQFLHVLYRPDRLRVPRTVLPVHPLAPEDGWCDDPSRPDYNQPVQLPYAASHERLWRQDPLYDIVVVLGHNHAPAVARLGSAVFFHLARSDLGPTEGCVAVARRHMLAVLAMVEPRTAILVA
jgi:L,D-peptidoglycan transpeptidase YkuD (ErfK/YbiS/YcfS/YnhG family)